MHFICNMVKTDYFWGGKICMMNCAAFKCIVFYYF